MSTIDERIVEIKFDNGQFEKGVLTTIKTLEHLEKATDLKNSSRGLKDLAAAAGSVDVSKMASSVDFIASRFTLLGRVANTVYDRIAKGAVDTGTALVKSLTVDQVGEGFGKYEQKTAAVQTIMAATGKSIEAVNGQLDRLSWFTDETSYSFVDMTSNIAKFTSQGVQLDASVTAMQGIANWAAKSGQGIDQASRAMYNLSQALGKGSVELIDWKSIQNANMDTIEFKQTVIDTAKELGVLTEAGKTKKGGLAVDTTNFADTLTKGEWFTTDVLMATLEKYGAFSDEVYKLARDNGISASEAMAQLGTDTESLGESAFKAAQQAKTFTDVMNATKDAVSSGWMNSFELIFGNYEQAVVLWSDLAEKMWSLFAEDAETRNTLLEGWQDKGGRDDLIEGLMAIVDAIQNIKYAAQDTFDRIFPPSTVDTILNISAAVKNFGTYLRDVTSYSEDGEIVIDSFTKTVTTASSALNELFGGKELKRGAKNNAEEVKKMQEHLKELGYDLGKAGADGILGPRTEAALKEFQEKQKLAITGIYDESSHNSLMQALGIQGGEDAELRQISKTSKTFRTNMQKTQNIFGGVLAVVGIAGKAFGFLGKVLKVAGKALKPLGDAMLTIGSAIGTALMGFNEWLDTSGVFESWIASITDALKPFTEWLQNGMDALLEFIGLSGERPAGTEAPIVAWWNKLKSSIDDNEVFKKLKTSFDRLKQALAPAEGIVKGYYNTIKTYLVDKFKTLFGDGEDDDTTSFWKTALESVGNAVVWFVDTVTPYASKIPELLNNLKEFLFGKDISATIRDFESTEHVAGAFEKISTFITNMYDTLKGSEKFQSMVETVKTVLTNLKDAVVGFFESLGKDSEAGGDKPENSIETKVDKIGDITDKISVVWDGIKSFLSDAASGAKSILDFVGPGGIVGIVASIVGIKAISSIGGAATSIGGLATSLTGVSDAFKEGSFFNKSEPKAKPLAKSILQIATAVALLVAAIYVLGKMDSDTLKQGGIVLGVVIAVLIGLGIAASKLKGDIAKNIESVGKSVKSLAIGLLIIAGAIWLLGGMSPDKLLKGGLALVGIMVLLAVFSKALKGLKIEVSMKGLIGLAVAIGILAIIINLVGKMNPGRFVKGFIGISLIMLLLRGFAKSLSSLGRAEINIKGLLKLAFAIGILAGIIYLIGGMDPTRFIGGFIGLAIIMTALYVFTKGMNKLSDMKMSVMGLISVVAMIGILAIAVNAIGKLPVEQAIQGILGVGILLVAVSIMMKAMSRLNVKSGISALIGLAGLALAMIAFGYAINMVKDIDADRVAAFAQGMGVVMLAFGAFIVSCGLVGIAGVGVALAAIVGIGLIIMGLMWLLNQPWMQDLISGALAGLAKSLSDSAPALSTIGAAMGIVSGSMKAAEAKAFASSLGAFDGMTVDETGINNAIKGAQLLSDFANGLPGRDLGTRISDFLIGSNLKSLSNDMVVFAEGTTAFTTAISTINFEGDLEGRTKEVISIATSISKFSAKLAPVPIIQQIPFMKSPMEQLAADMLTLASGFKSFSDSLVNVPEDNNALLTKTKSVTTIAKTVSEFATTLAPVPLLQNISFMKSPMDQLAADMLTLASGFKSFSDALVDVPEDSSTITEKTNSVVKIAKTVSNFSANLSPVPALLNIPFMTSPMEKLASDMLTLVTGFTSFSDAMADVPADSKSLASKTKAVISIAKTISTFASTMPEPLMGNSLKGWIMGETALSTLAEDMTEFAKGITDWGTAVSGMSDSTITTDTASAIASATSIAGFIASLKTLGDKIDDRSGLDKFLGTGASTADTLFGKMKLFGDSIKDINTSFIGIGDLTSGVGIAEKAIDQIVALLERLSGGDVKVDDATWNWAGTFSTVMDKMATIGESIVDFSNQTKDVSADEFSTFISAINTLVTALSLIGQSSPVAAVEQLKSAIDQLKLIFEGEGIGKIDPEAFMNGLDPVAIATKISEAATVISTAASTAASDISGSTTAFNDTGSAIGSALASGVSSDTSGIDAVKGLVGRMSTAASGMVSGFVTAGANFSRGLARGMSSYTWIVEAAARAVANSAVTAAKQALDEHSPSKVAEEIGSFFDKGMVKGIDGGAKEVANSGTNLGTTVINSTKSALSSLADVLASDIDADPVIKPVVDLSNVTSGAKQISGLMNDQSRITMQGIRSQNLASTISVRGASDKPQNGSAPSAPTAPETPPTGLEGLFAGAQFNIRNENDARLLGSELAYFANQGQRNYGAPVKL